MSSPNKLTSQLQGLSHCPLNSQKDNSALLNVPLRLLLVLVKTEIILQPFRVRLHSGIGRQPWARLWYLLRGFDGGVGWVKEIPLVVLCQILDVSQATIYRWLAEGEGVGAFRPSKHRIKKGLLTVYLGGLTKVAWNLNLKDWGVVAECPLWEVNANIRALTTGIVTQRLQQRSRYAANRRLKPEYRKSYGAPHPNELLGNRGQSSPEMGAGEIPFILHVGPSRVFASKNFVHFGTSQRAISCKLGIHPRTVRRHQQALGMTRRQLCQAKYEYRQLQRALDNESPECWAWSDDGVRSEIGYQSLGESAMPAAGGAIAFADGIPQGAKKKEPNKYQIPTSEFDHRFFKMGDKMWMNRCNIYREVFTLKTMTAARRKWRLKLSQCHFQENRAVPQVDDCKAIVIDPRI